MQEYRSCKLQDYVSRTSLQTGMQNFVSTKSHLTNKQTYDKQNEIKQFSQKFEIQGFIISVMICEIALKITLNPVVP